MPKLKSNRSAAKRFKQTGTGKLKRQKAGRRHLLTCKTAGRKRNLRDTVTMDGDSIKNIKRMLPYGCK